MSKHAESGKIKIVKADKKFRFFLFVLYGTILVTGALFFKFLAPLIVCKFQGITSQTYYILGETVIIFFLLLFIVPAWWLISIGRKIKFYEQFPYPGMKVMRDTRVIEGKKAVFRGKMLVALGFLTCIVAVLSSIRVHLIFQNIAQSDLLSHLPLF
jgi:hypothetical protein